ncbi:hypothetical protein [Streptomyces sp. NPDC059468]|uniref:hypothetical protein n=1 Tax=Streptomyces sp. NPDC059468 TaxID=3346845 RepID=UPI003693406D
MNVGNISAIANGFTSRLNRLQFPNSPRPAAQRSTGGQNAPQKTAAPAANPGQATAGPGRARANTSAPAAAPTGRSRANTPTPAPSAAPGRPRPNAPTPTVTAGDFHFQQAMARSAELLHRTDRTKAKTPEGKSIMRDADRARGRDYGTLVAQDRANVAGAKADLTSHFDAVKTEIFRSHVSRTAQPTPTPQPVSPAQPTPAPQPAPGRGAAKPSPAPAPKKVAPAPVQGSQKPSPAPAPAPAPKPGRGAKTPVQTSPVNSDQQFEQKNYAPAATAAPRPSRKYTPPQPEAPAGGMPTAKAATPAAKPGSVQHPPEKRVTPKSAEEWQEEYKQYNQPRQAPEKLYSSDYGGTKVKVQVTTPEHTRDDAQTWKEVHESYPNAESITVHHAGGTYSLMKMRGNAPEHSTSAVKGRQALLSGPQGEALPRKERFAKGKANSPRVEESPEHTRFEHVEGQMAFGDEPAGKPVEGVKMAASKRPQTQTSKWGGLRQEKPTPPPVQVHPKPKAAVPAPVKNPQQFPSSDEFNSMLNDVVNESKAPAAPAEQPAALAKAGVRETRLKVGGKEHVVRTVHNGSTAQLESKHTRAVKAALEQMRTAHNAPQVKELESRIAAGKANGAKKSVIAANEKELRRLKNGPTLNPTNSELAVEARKKPSKVRYTTEVPEHLKPFLGDGPDDPNQSRYYGIGKK